MNIYVLVLITFLIIVVAMGIGYLVLRAFGLAEVDTREKDRAIMEELGDEEIIYSNDYFNQLTKKSQVTDNLPTSSCQQCGAALNPDDKFCAKCGQNTEIWQ